MGLDYTKIQSLSRNLIRNSESGFWLSANTTAVVIGADVEVIHDNQALVFVYNT